MIITLENHSTGQHWQVNSQIHKELKVHQSVAGEHATAPRELGVCLN